MRNSYLLNSSSGMDTSRRTLYFRNRRYRWTILEKKKYILHNLNFLHKHIVYYAPRTRIYRIQWNQYVRIFLFLLLSYFIQNAYLNERASYSTCNHRHHLAFAYCPNHRKIELNIFLYFVCSKIQHSHGRQYERFSANCARNLEAQQIYYCKCISNVIAFWQFARVLCLFYCCVYMENGDLVRCVRISNCFRYVLDGYIWRACSLMLVPMTGVDEFLQKS